MRNRLRLRPDPYDYSLLGGVQKELAGKAPSEPNLSLSKLASALPAGGGAASASLALDLVLNEIAEKARLSSGASGVAIALTRSGDLVCRATTGSAPDMGVRLNPHAGLSGLCLQTKSVQRCDDTEADSRVDAEACRTLRARSILVVPIRKKEEVVGLLEAFAANPAHFREHDITTFESFCEQIVSRVDQVVEASTDSKSSAPTDARSANADLEAMSPRTRGVGFRPGDRWTLVLTCGLIAIALFLGWMLGRSDKHRASTPSVARFDTKPTPRPGNKPIENNVPSGIVTNAKIVPPQTAPAQPGVGKFQGKKMVSGLSESKNLNTANPGDGLVVYQNGRVLFRENAGQGLKPANGGATSPGEVSGRIVPAGETTLLNSNAANDYLTRRVEPQYPELARQERIQGPVLLKVMVGKDGGVQQVQVLKGDPKLAAAASSAVVQWRFKPVLRAGRAVEFETKITVDFKLP